MKDGNTGLKTQPATTESAKEKKQKITAISLYKLIESQGFKCALTGWDLEPATASLDHIQPLSKGGSHLIDNAQVVHSLVNTAKGTLSTEEFVAICLAVATHHCMRSDR